MTDAPFRIDESPKHLWLSPQCGACGCDEGRTWCVDDMGECEECSSPSVKYVRADLVAALKARVGELEAVLADKQWEVVVTAVERYSRGDISDLHALGLVASGILHLDDERRAALKQEQPAILKARAGEKP